MCLFHCCDDGVLLRCLQSDMLGLDYKLVTTSGQWFTTWQVTYGVGKYAGLHLVYNLCIKLVHELIEQGCWFVSASSIFFLMQQVCSVAAGWSLIMVCYIFPFTLCGSFVFNDALNQCLLQGHLQVHQGIQIDSKTARIWRVHVQQQFKWYATCSIPFLVLMLVQHGLVFKLLNCLDA